MGMIVPPNRNSEDSESDSDDPDVGNIFENSEGQVDYKTAMVYWMTKCKEKAKQKDKSTDYRILVKYICGLPALKENYDFQHQQNVIKKILKYLTLYNRVFSPERDLDKNELEGSMLLWIPKSQTQISM